MSAVEAAAAAPVAEQKISSRLQKYMDQKEPTAQVAAQAPSKREIALHKKLREIEELKRRAEEDGAMLKASQKEKVAERAAILAELVALSPNVDHEALCRSCCQNQGRG